MVVPVVLAGCSFDYTPMRREQARLSKTLVLPSPRDKDDTAQTLEIEDDQATPFKYPTFIKVRYDKEGGLPIFELYAKDNFDQEYKISKERRYNNRTNTYIDGSLAGTLNTTQGINDDPLVAGFLPQSNLNNNYAVDPITGEIYRNAYYDEGLKAILDNSDRPITNPNFSGQRVGTIKFDGITGLGLAAVNTRIADISNAVEGVTKVLSVASSNMDAVINLVR